MKKIIRIFVIVLSLVIVLFIFLLMRPYSEGTRVGTLVKLSKKGFIFKTWEGELNMAMIVGENAAASAEGKIWLFSVKPDKDETLITELNNLQGQRVILYYKEYLFTFFWNGDTNYFVYKVELAK